jgi:DNA-binding response OmpR family regulator
LLFETDPVQTVNILSVSPMEQDHIWLDRILNHAECSACNEPTWTLLPILTLADALPLLRENRMRIVLAEGDLLPGTWRDVLAEIVVLPDPPLLIVTSRLADERLWAEALNLGAYDVLAKPFDREEVVRVLGLAWLRQTETVHRKPNPTAISAHGALDAENRRRGKSERRVLVSAVSQG